MCIRDRVILLADHQADAFVLGQAQHAPLFLPGKLRADQMAFYQGKSRDMRQFVHIAVSYTHLDVYKRQVRAI